MRTFYAITIIVIMLSAIGCTAAPVPCNMVQDNTVGTNRDMAAAGLAKITLYNDTNDTLFFRMIRNNNNIALTKVDMEIKPGDKKSLTPVANPEVTYRYIIFANGQADSPMYSCAACSFSAGTTWKLDMSTAAHGEWKEVPTK